MQTDDDVGKLATATPFLMSRAIEVFIKRIVEQAVAIQKGEGADHITLTVFDIQKCIETSDEFDFVRDTCRAFIESLPEKHTSHKNSPIVKSVKEIPAPEAQEEAEVVCDE